MAVTIRKATPGDAELLVRVIDMASEGLLPTLWEAMAPEGMDATAVGLSMVSAQDGEFSFANGFVLENDGKPIGGMIGYPLPDTPKPPDPAVPAAFAPIEELTNLAPSHWYVNVVALDPAWRGNGLGSALLDEAEGQALSAKCPGMALIVAASNAVARHAYERAGFLEVTRRPFDLSEFGEESTEAVLMIKTIAAASEP